MDPKDRQALGKAGLTSEEAAAKERLRLERDDQKGYAGWLNSHEIYYLWSRTDKATTIQPGHPDFTIFHRGLVLFGEFKRCGNKQSPDQVRVNETLVREHFDYFLWYSLEEAIKTTKRFFSL
jgi:hypothetical protein